MRSKCAPLALHSSNLRPTIGLCVLSMINGCFVMSKKNTRCSKKKIIDSIQVTAKWELSDRNESWEKLWDHLILLIAREIEEEDPDGRK